MEHVSVSLRLSWQGAFTDVILISSRDWLLILVLIEIRRGGGLL